MKPMRFVLIGITVVLFSFLFVLSCDNATEGEDATAEDIAKFVEVMSIFDWGETTPECVTESESETQASLTFTNCEFDGVIVNGTVTMAFSGTETQASITFTGTLNFTGAGAPASSVSFNFTLTIDMSSYPYSFAMSGTVTIDGTVFNASGFMNDFLNYYAYF